LLEEAEEAADALVGARAVPHPAPLLGGQLRVRRVDGELDLRGLADEVAEVLAPLVRAERGDGALPDREVRVGDDEVLVEAGDAAEALARRARAERGVEAEELRRRLLEAHPVALEQRRERQRLQLPLLRRGHDDGALAALAE